MPSAVDISHVSFRYGQRLALDDVSLAVESQEIFAIVGPNGGGKTTLFRLLTTLIPLQEGEIHLLGGDVRGQLTAVRQQIGVVFQAPSLDKKLTVRENLLHQGHLYGLSGRALAERSHSMLEQLGVADRAGDRVETLSGGLRRRVEIAKALLHQPRLLLMDEPSTGLDPAARSDLWRYLASIQQQGVTIVLTTHLLDEAEKSSRLAILHSGRIVALDTPEKLRAEVGGDAITIGCDDPQQLAAAIHQRFNLEARVADGRVRMQQPEGHRVLAQLLAAFSEEEELESISLEKPSLADVFLAKTGHRFWAEVERSPP